MSLLTADGLAPVRCPERESCLGGDNSSCAEGHTGALCGVCDDGHFRSNGACVLCDADAPTSVALYASAAVVTLAAAFAFMYVQLARGSGGVGAADGDQRGGPPTTAASPPRPSSRRRGALGTLVAQLTRRAVNGQLGTLAKVLLGYFQVLGAFRRLSSVRWPALFTRYLDALTPFSFEVFSLYPLGCSVALDVTFAHELLGTLLLPVVGAVLVLLVAWLAAQCTLPKKEHGLCAVAARPETCTLQLWLLLLLYPSLAKTALMPFDCVEIGGESLLRAHPAEACDGGEWRVLAVLGVLGTVVYSLGFPLLCLLVTRASARKEAAGGGGSGANRARARLLLRSYTVEFWYWESLDIFRKYLLTSVVLVVPFQDSLLQVYLGLLVCVVSLVLVARHQPYADPLCGRVQTLCLVQLTFTYMSGMLFFDVGDGGIAAFGPQVGSGSGGSGGGGGGNDDDGEQDGWGAVLVGANILAFALLAFGLTGALRGALQDAQAELERQRALAARLREEKEAMRLLLEQPTQGGPSQAEASSSSSSVSSKTRRQTEVLKRARISMDQLTLERRLGSGMFGEVSAAKYNGTPVAVKTMHAHHKTAEAHVAAFRDEVLLLLELRHPNIVQLIGGSWDVDSGDMCLVLELCAGGSLEDLLEDNRTPLTWIEELLPLATGVARGMAYLHGQSPPIVHRDLKPANVLLLFDLTPKIADMGTALELFEGMEEHVAGAGSPLFQAPEVLRKEAADQSCDLWSYGCLLCCLSSRDVNPYHPTQPAAAVAAATQFALRPNAAGSPLEDVVASATALEYEDRPPFEELLHEVSSAATSARARAADGDGRARQTDAAVPPREQKLPRPGTVSSSLMQQEGGGGGGGGRRGGSKGGSKGGGSSGDRGGSSSEGGGDGGGGAGPSSEQQQRSVSCSSAAKLAESSVDLRRSMFAEEPRELTRAERLTARRRSLHAADSMRSLTGHKEGPGRFTERNRGSVQVPAPAAAPAPVPAPEPAPAPAPAAEEEPQDERRFAV